jgi:PD-(D/E)XK nuclease superfamily
MAKAKKQSAALVKIDASIVPPTRQSTELLMGCKKNYVTQIIEGRRNPGGVDSMRGREIHHTMSLYLSHCARKNIAMDLTAFDEFGKGAGVLASKILVGVRDSYQTDCDHLFATEVKMHLDEEFNPTHLSAELDGVCADSGNPVAYEGTPDGIFLYRQENRIVLDDFKSHPRPYNPSDPDKSMQGKEYSLFCFRHFAWVQEVKFRLVFVRFRNLIRDVTYTREDIPSLIEAVRSLRARQRTIHEEYIAGKEIEATGNDGCFYCPLLSDRECPILRDNPNAQGEPSEWLSSALVYSAYARVNNARMKAWVQTNGKSILLRDYNQKCFTFGPVESEATILPLFQATADGIAMDKEGNPSMPLVSLLMDYAHSTPDDTSWMGKLNISSSSITPYLKAKKRVNIHQAIQDTAEKVTKVKMKVSKPLDVLPPDESDEEESDESWEDDEF